MNIILFSGWWQFLLVYLNDIVIFGKYTAEQNNHLHKVLKFLKDDVVTRQFKTCELFSSHIDYLGPVIKPWSLEARPHPIEVAHSLHATSFLVLCNIFQWFVPNFARTTAPFNCKLQMEQLRANIELSEQEIDALQTCEKELTSPTMHILSQWQLTVLWNPVRETIKMGANQRIGIEAIRWRR